MNIVFRDDLLTYCFKSDGTDHGTLDLTKLYPDRSDLSKFCQRYEAFIASDKANEEVFKKHEARLEYATESIIPRTTVGRVAVLLLFGNPAPHSIKNGAMFSYEGKGREHRIWHALRATEMFYFPTEPGVKGNSAVIHKRIAALRDGTYESVYCLGFSSFISIPSTPSDPAWSGVAGVARLFGPSAFRAICHSEKHRIRQLLRSFMPSGGIVLAFQKTAYEQMGDGNVSFSLAACLKSELVNIPDPDLPFVLASGPPTRLLRGGASISALTRSLKIADRMYRERFTANGPRRGQ